MSRREDVIDAALLVLAEGGLKGLTHRAVDARAGLPQGSTANLFRSRDSLVRALLAELEHRDLGAFDVDAASAARTPDGLAVLLAHGVERMLAPESAPLTRARLTMMPAYPEEAATAHRRLLASLESLMSRCGFHDAATRTRMVAALIDGVLLHELTVSPGELDTAALIESIRELLGE